jgi:hypothetical protein
MVISAEDWSDVAGWDDYHAKQSTEPHSPHDLGLHFAKSFWEKGFSRIWFPGCGTCWSARVFAELDFQVLATDFSPVAVAAQEALARARVSQRIEAWLREVRRPESGASHRQFSVRLHDFRSALDEPPFDVVLNRRAFQGLSAETMAEAAAVHEKAVRPGGWAIFDTMNVQGVRRDHLEEALVHAGFVVPLYETDRWYRAALRETGVEFVMLLGRPIIPGPHRSAADKAKLEAVRAEYMPRAERELAATRSLLESPDAKIAHVVYSTG